MLAINVIEKHKQKNANKVTINTVTVSYMDTRHEIITVSKYHGHCVQLLKRRHCFQQNDNHPATLHRLNGTCQNIWC